MTAWKSVVAAWRGRAPAMELGLWCGVLAAVLLTVAIWRGSRPADPTISIAAPLAASDPVVFESDVLTAITDSVVARDPFRLDRRPPTVAFGSPPAPPPPPPGSVPTDALALKGVVGGPPWQAILAGVPGRSGNVVAVVGDTMAGFRIRSINSSRIVIVSPDSVRTLTLKPSWQ